MSSSTGLRFYVGTTESGEAVYGDFQTAGHFISAGSTGSGHASFDEAAFMTYMLQNYTPDELQFVMIDPKQVQLVPYENIPHLWRPLAMTPDSVRDAVIDLHKEMIQRFQLFANLGVRSIAEYNAQSEESLPSIILLATEIADLMMIDGEFYNKAFGRLAAKGRAVGIHLYLATQRPSPDVISDTILGEVRGRLVFAVANEADSVRLLGESGAEKITKQGRLFFADNRSGIRENVKAPLVTDEEVVKIVNNIETKYAT